MIKPVDHINNWLKRVSENGDNIEREDMFFLMVQARHLIEKSPDIDNYRTIEFYADWTVHTQLDRSEMCISVLRDVTKVLAENWGHTKKDIRLEISKVIGLGNLRSEMISLFEENKLPSQLFSIYENWLGIASLLTYYLRGKPLVFPKQDILRNKKARAVREETLGIEKPADFWIKSLSIVGEKDAYWMIELGGEKNTAKIMGSLLVEKDHQ